MFFAFITVIQETLKIDIKFEKDFKIAHHSFVFLWAIDREDLKDVIFRSDARALVTYKFTNWLEKAHAKNIMSETNIPIPKKIDSCNLKIGNFDSPPEKAYDFSQKSLDDDDNSIISNSITAYSVDNVMDNTDNIPEITIPQKPFKADLDTFGVVMKKLGSVIELALNKKVF